MDTQTNKQLYSDGLLNLLKEQAVDVLLKAKGCNTETAISAHKLILSARSEVFKKMFESDIGKATTKVETITLSEFEPEELDAFIEFIYSDGSMLSEKAKKHTMSLYRAADKYEIPHLRDLCRDTLLASINSSNALKIVEVAEIPFDKVLTDAAFKVIKSNQSTIFSSTEFKAFVDNHSNLTVEILKAISGPGTRNCSYCGRESAHHQMSGNRGLRMFGRRRLRMIND